MTLRACIDIGGTKVSVSLNDPVRGLELLAHQYAPTARAGDNDALARQVVTMVDAACAQLGVEPMVVQDAGVAAPGPFVLGPGGIELATPNICGAVAMHACPTTGAPRRWRARCGAALPACV